MRPLPSSHSGPTTYGVGVMYFAIFAASEESIIDLESRSEVIQGHRF